jgi:hypothetical protein
MEVTGRAMSHGPEWYVIAEDGVQVVKEEEVSDGTRCGRIAKVVILITFNLEDMTEMLWLGSLFHSTFTHLTALLCFPFKSDGSSSKSHEGMPPSRCFFIQPPNSISWAMSSIQKLMPPSSLATPHPSCKKGINDPLPLIVLTLVSFLPPPSQIGAKEPHLCWMGAVVRCKIVFYS